jgi:uncharacterized protein (TIGR04255 family)
VNIPWRELIQPHIAGILGSTDIGIEAMQKDLSTHEFRLGAGQTFARLVHGLASDKATGEQVYLLDIDLFSDNRLEIPDILIKLDEFNHLARRLFQWCVTDRLLEGLKSFK